MSAFSQLHFLQALGWATLNSFWQMGLLWSGFLFLNTFFKFSAAKKYSIAVLFLFLGFAWFLATAILYTYNETPVYTFFRSLVSGPATLLQTCLLSASITYLFLLLLPVSRLIKNWRHVQFIKHEGLLKAAPEHRLFVGKIAAQLSIGRKVKVAVSRFVQSPLTIGYIRPLILLPAAALSTLTPVQVEAVLLHELAHIRRYDYLVNLMIAVIHTLLYFNPFVRLFMQVAESERETCCDEWVLRFGYDKVKYASALLQLEKSSLHYPVLALGATGKNNLLTRIEKIVGMEKKKSFRLIQLAPLVVALICLLLFNSVLMIRDVHTGPKSSYAYENIFMPWPVNSTASQQKTPQLKPQPDLPFRNVVVTPTNQLRIDIYSSDPSTQNNNESSRQPLTNLTPVTFDEIDGNLSKEEKENVSSAVEATKKVLRTTQWKQIENSMADALSKQEKAMAKQKYLEELNKVNWNRMEQNLKANYDQLDWAAINENVQEAMKMVQADSIQRIYALAAKELDNLEKEIKTKAKANLVPIPDASIYELKLARETVLRNLDSIKKMAPKKIIRL